MKIVFTLSNSAAALKRLRSGKPASVVFAVQADLLLDQAGLESLREAVDLCIDRGLKVAIPGVMPCFLPGYARYLKPAPGACAPCPKAEKCFLKAGCRGIPAGYSGLASRVKPPERGFTDLEKCMLEILRRKNGVTTEQALKAARKIKICASCTSEGEVFRAAERLIRLGLIAKEYSGGVYIWRKN